MATTTNFGWETPDDTDLVKDGALAMRTLGNAIDASLVDLKGGTTGQVLSKTSNTDMDFTWVTSDDANAIQNAIVDAKGDLITATAADTPARLAVGSNGDTLVADSAATTGLRWQGNYAAGKNAIINGDFRINQRSFTSTTSTATYTFDRWLTRIQGDGTSTYSAQTFTAGAAPVAGYEAINFIRIVTTGQTAANAATLLFQRIEDPRTFAGRTVTISFWAKAASGTPKVGIAAIQNFGSGGSPSSQTYTVGTSATISTSWARYSATITIPSVSGKTFGTDAGSGFLSVSLCTSAATGEAIYYGDVGIQSATIDIWGVQIETGSVATAFQTATGTLQGELAAAMRYYQKSYNQSVTAGTTTDVGSIGMFTQATQSYHYMPSVSFGVRMRATPTVTVYSSTGASGKIRNVGGAADVNAAVANAGESGFTAFVNNSSIAGGNELRCHWVSEIEL
jgi:hypothetical protein